MEQLQLIKAKLLNDTENFRLGEKSKKLLKMFSEHQGLLENTQEAFVSACQEAGLSGSESLILASRLKCEHIIKGVFTTMNLNANIDSITPILMVDKKEKN